ncbi:MAG: BatA domain-containing protein [Akkermansiaceae bacterium]|jgi:hypothetical protein|nr:BatA domain-containing protein [Luteolibacter sp.]
MSFLNPFILLGALGIGLPILAHLLNRLQVQRTDWAAMQFLNRSVRVRSRQLRLRDVLLLILRCLALLLLIFAIARPAWKGDSASWIPGEKRAGVVIAVDSSFSMQHGEKGSSRFDLALKQVATISGKIEAGDPVTLVLLGGDEKLIAHNMIFDPNKWDDVVEKLVSTPTTTDWDSVPKRLKEFADDMDSSQKEIYIVTDVQARDWKKRSSQFHQALVDLGSGASVFMVPVSGDGANLAVTDLDLVSGALRKGTIARYQATVRNYGTEPVSNVEVRCKVEGIQIDSKEIPVIAPGASGTVSLFVPFHNAGTTPITAEISGDLLEVDNVRRVVAVVSDQVSVLCVDGSSGGEAGKLVSAALTARGDGSAGEAYTVRTIPWLSFPSEDLEKIDVIILTDVPEITKDQSVQLSRFVREGNGLVWFAGDDVKAASWNEQTGDGGNPLLPATVGQLVNTSDAVGAGKPLDPNMPDHAVCSPLRSLAEDLFSETRFLKCLELKPAASSFTVLRLAGSGSPILLEQSLGRGQVFMFATSAQITWNNMALTPVFPMLMQQIVTYLAGREFERPQTVGESLSLSFVEEPDASDAVFDTPSGETITVPVREYRKQYVSMIDSADEVGFYTARVSVQSSGIPIAVNVDTAESEIASLPAEELKDYLKDTGIIIAANDADLSAAIDMTRTGRSSWRFFMMAGLAFLIIECLFADRLLRRQESKNTQQEPMPSGA